MYDNNHQHKNNNYKNNNYGLQKNIQNIKIELIH